MTFYMITKYKIITFISSPLASSRSIGLSHSVVFAVLLSTFDQTVSMFSPIRIFLFQSPIDFFAARAFSLQLPLAFSQGQSAPL